MIRKLMLSFAAVFLSAGFAWSVDCYYLPNGTGTWADSTRWKKGTVPQSGDNVYIEGGTAHVTSADLPTLTPVNAVVLADTESSIAFDLDEDFHFDKRIIGLGKIVKNGTGALYLDIDNYQLLKTDMGIEVNDGEIHLSEESNRSGHVYEYGPICVNAPGKVFFCKNQSSSTPGLSGDGIVTNVNASGRELQLVGNFAGYEGVARAFSGKISPNVELTFAGVERQDFLSDQTDKLTVRAHSGTVGIKHFGNEGEPGSLGTDAMWLRGGATFDPIRYVYIGEADETSSKPFKTAGTPQGAVLDGGARGGLTLTGGLKMTSETKTSVEALYLDGSNVDHRCTLNGPLSESSDLAVHTFLTKRGIGTWRIVSADNFNLRGGVAIERGVLEADVLAEQGRRSSLGYALVRQSRYYGVPDPTKDVNWAILLGDGSMPADAYSGTLAYVGAEAVSVANRPIALNGAGRIRNDSGAAFTWTGITAENDATHGHALVLDGVGTDNVIRSVTNGVGKITVVKEGSGIWTIDGEHDVSALEARGGTLNVKVSSNYRYYRLNVKQLWGATDVSLMISRLALFDADGVCCNLGLAHNTAADGDISRLQPSQWAFTTKDYSMSRDASHLFVENFQPDPNDENICTFYFHPNAPVVPTPDDEDSWMRLVMRVAEDVQPIVRYDLCGYNMATKNGREAKGWSLEGSCDGISWTELHSVQDNPTPVTDKYQWYSTRSQTYEAGVTGYAVSPEAGDAVLKTRAVEYVLVSGGATLVVDKPVTASNIRYDGKLGGGTLKGFAFPESGTIDVRNLDFSESDGVLDLTFEDCTGVENLAGWTVMLDDKANRASVVMTADGKLRIVRFGMILILR